MEKNALGYFQKFTEEIDRLWEERRTIYIYGAGKYAKSLYRFLCRYGKTISGFLVTSETKKEYEGKPVIEFRHIINQLDSSVGIILAMKNNFQDEVKNRYGEVFQNQKVGLLAVDESMLQSLYIGPVEERMEEWRRQANYSQELNKELWENILVIQLEHVIGDYIWATAFLRELRANFPRAHITYVIHGRAYNIFKNCPYIDELISYGNQNLETYSRTLEEKVKEFKEIGLGSRQYEVAFLVKAVPCNEMEAIENVLIALYSHAKLCITHGYYVFLNEIVYTDFWKSLFPVIAINDKAEHDVSKDLSLLRICGLDIKDERMELWPSPEEKKWAESLLMKSVQAQNKVVIALGVAAREERRSWPAKYYAELISRLETRNKQLCYVVFGGDNAVEAAEIIEKCGADILNIAGKTTLAESIAVMEQCDLYVGSDTSLLHMAAAFGHPIIELTANLKDGYDTDIGHPVRTGPWKVPGKVIYPQIQLDGCTHVCVKKYAHCITQIDVAEVEEAVLDMIGLFSMISRL